MLGRRIVQGILATAVVFIGWSGVALSNPSQDKKVRVDNIVPSPFGPGFEISITGGDFRSVDTVKIGRLVLQEMTITQTEIRGVVPKQLKKASKIAVFRGGKQVATFRGFAFTPAPRVLSVHPAFGEPGRKVTLNGEALDTVKSVKIGTRSISPDTISNNRITFFVPEGTKTGIIAVVSSIATIYSQEKFEVFYPPTLTAADKNGGYPGDTVILTGMNLGNAKVRFKLGKLFLKVVNRHPTSATVILPTGVRSGRFSVTSRGHADTLESDFTVYQKKTPRR
jgi:hypothetical protein